MGQSSTGFLCPEVRKHPHLTEGIALSPWSPAGISVASASSFPLSSQLSLHNAQHRAEKELVLNQCPLQQVTKALAKLWQD